MLGYSRPTGHNGPQRGSGNMHATDARTQRMKHAVWRSQTVHAVHARTFHPVPRNNGLLPHHPQRPAQRHPTVQGVRGPSLAPAAAPTHISANDDYAAEPRLLPPRVCKQRTVAGQR